MVQTLNFFPVCPLDGRNACIFTFGECSSGKTWTMVSIKLVLFSFYVPFFFSLVFVSLLSLFLFINIISVEWDIRKHGTNGSAGRRAFPRNLKSKKFTGVQTSHYTHNNKEKKRNNKEKKTIQYHTSLSYLCTSRILAAHFGVHLASFSRQHTL